MRAYERLSQVYDSGWGDFTRQYLSLIDRLLSGRGIIQARVLDLACGTGALAIALARRGHSVHGIDISPEMIAIAESKASGMSGVSFDLRDMRRLCIQDKFDLVTCTFDSLNYLLEMDDIKILFHRVCSVLRGAGLFVFDSNTIQHYLKAGRGSLKRLVGGESFTQEWRYNPTRKEAVISFQFPDGSREVHKQYPYDLTELLPVIIEAGFRVVSALDGFSNRPYSSDSARLVCVAERRIDSPIT